MQAGLTWEIGLPGKRGQKNSFNLVQPGTYPIQSTENGWEVDAEPVTRTDEEPILAPTPTDEPTPAPAPGKGESILAPTPADEPQTESVEPAEKSDVEPAVFNEAIKEQPEAKEKSVLELNDK